MNRELLEFIQQSPTAYHAVASTSARLLEAGFTELNEKEKWEINKEEIEQFAKRRNMAYFETSAKTRKGIDESFSHVANVAYEKIEAEKQLGEEEEDDKKIEIKKEDQKKKNKDRRKKC